jgi:hypothetical protein
LTVAEARREVERRNYALKKKPGKGDRLIPHKTITELKHNTRQGDLWTLVWARYHNKHLNVTQPVSVIQFRAVGLDGATGTSWLQWPKSADYEATDKGFKVYEPADPAISDERHLSLEYTIERRLGDKTR